MKRTLKNLKLAILIVLAISSSLFSQINLSGDCFANSFSLPSAGIVNGKEAFNGTGTVMGNPNVQVSVYWEPVAPGWVLAFSGQPYYLEDSDTDLPVDSEWGNWTSLSGVPCPMNTVEISGASTLPVEYGYISGKLRNEEVYLNWQTVSEINNMGFEVERELQDGRWEKLGFVKGAGFSSRKVAYEFIDVSPKQGFNYYRLKQVDMNGAFEFSEVVAVDKRLFNGEIVVYPNPASHSLKISGVDLIDAEVKVYNTIGNVVKVIKIDSPDAILSIESFPIGTYTLEVKRNNEIFVSRFVKV